MQPKRIPKKITPERLIDSIVDVHYSSKLPKEVLIGSFYKEINKSGDFEYLKQEVPLPYETPFLVQHEPKFVGKGVVIHIGSNNITLNCSGPYLGWGSYRQIVEEVLNTLIRTGDVDNFTRIGVRYISLFENIDVSKRLEVPFPTYPNLEEPQTNRYNSGTKTKNGLKVVLNISTGISIPNYKGLSSLIDIDVIDEELKTKVVSEVLERIDEVHSQQKQIFFGLLTNEFIETLNPEYDE